ENYRDIVVHDTWSDSPTDAYVNYDKSAKYFSSYITVTPFIFKEKKSNVHYNWGASGPFKNHTDDFMAIFDQSQNLNAGDYFVQTLADDRVRVTFDDKKIIDRWYDSGGQIDRALLTNMTKGQHSIQTDFYENAGNAVIFSDIVPFDHWLAYYYPNKNLEGTPSDAKVIAPKGSEKVLFEDSGIGSPTSKVPNDNFSVRYTTIKRLPAGEYIIRGKADDGMRVFIDGKQVIDRWYGSGGYVEDAQKVIINDNAGAAVLGKSTEKDIHLVEVQYLEEGGLSKVEFGMEPYKNAILSPQWTAEYYPNKDLKGNALVKGGKGSIDQINNIDFNWGSASPSPIIPSDNFSARFTKIDTFEQGNYHFQAKADDGVRLYIDDKRILDSWGPNGGDIRTVTVPITAGQHKIVLEYLEEAGQALLQFTYKKQ
ncbi:PA14 domain-containing protein, partial [Bacillus cereus]